MCNATARAAVIALPRDTQTGSRARQRLGHKVPWMFSVIPDEIFNVIPDVRTPKR